MWIVELEFTDNPSRLAARPAHRELLATLHRDGVVKMAGPFADDSGAILLVDVADRLDVDAFIASDPYYATPGVTVARVRQWAPVVG